MRRAILFQKKLKWEHIQSKTTLPPKLTGCNAATHRSHILVCKLLAENFLDPSVPTESAAIAVATSMWECLQCLSHTKQDSRQLKTSAENFALQYEALRAASPDPLWRVMPKMHLFLELTMQQARPEKIWTYRDEDFGGTLAKQSRMKGSWKQAKSFSQHALHLFAYKNPEPRLMSL